MTMRRAVTILASALAMLALAGAALASPGTRPDMELTIQPEEPAAGSAVLIQAYVHFGPKPYQGAQVRFELSGPGLSAMTINAKPGEAGFYRAQFTPQTTGDFTVTTIVDDTVVSPKPFHFQVSGAALPDWTQAAAGGIALAAAFGLGAILFRCRATAGRAVTVTNS
jgi:hypothetical protein